MITYLDENDFIKKKKALKKYFRRSYKFLLFEVIKNLKKPNKKDGLYEVELPIDEVFKKVYGKLKIKFQVINDVVVIEDLVPSDILIECYMKFLPTYKGIPYRNKKDLFKIKLLKKKEIYESK